MTDINSYKLYVKPEIIQNNPSLNKDYNNKLELIFNSYDQQIQKLQSRIEELENQIAILNSSNISKNLENNNILKNENNYKLAMNDYFYSTEYVNHGKKKEVTDILSYQSSQHEAINASEFTALEGKDGEYVKINDFVHSLYQGINIVSINLIRATLEEASKFKEFLDPIIKENNKIIIDLTKCTFLDSTFLGVFVHSLKKSIGVGGDIRIVWGENTESFIFFMTKMNQVFRLFDNLEDAIQSYSN